MALVKVEEIKMEVDVKIDQLVENTNEMDQKIDFIVEKIEELTSWIDGAAYAWDKFGKGYSKDTLRSIKRRIAKQNEVISKKSQSD